MMGADAARRLHETDGIIMAEGCGRDTLGAWKPYERRRRLAIQ